MVRVTKTALTISKEEGADDFICEMATLLHDVANEKLNASEAEGFAKLINFLDSQSLPVEMTEEILTIIQGISFKGGHNQVELPLEGRVVQDADMLDALGAIGIARTMAYSGNKGRLIHDPNKQARENMTLEEYCNGEDTAIMHFYEKLLKLKDLMNTETGKRLAEQRYQFMLDYLEQFYAEWEGERKLNYRKEKN
ncbi:TPA: HD domain-containing protein, partial [Streptococcus equi subsp. zooepidemicus]|nr:HD domain-containing protein [Streptococcus equi subsp. zooepidemicus]